MSAINSIEVEEPEVAEMNERHGFYHNYQEPEANFMQTDSLASENTVIIRSRASSAANLSRKSAGGVKSESSCWKWCKKCCVCTCTFIFIALVVAIVVLIVFHYSSKYVYNKEEMAALQPKLLRRVERLMQRLNESIMGDDSLQDFDNSVHDEVQEDGDSKYRIVRNKTCYTRSCLETSKLIWTDFCMVEKVWGKFSICKRRLIKIDGISLICMSI